MEITIGEEGLVKTWQGGFPETTTCSCGGEARIGFVAHEGLSDDDRDANIKRVCHLHENEGKGGYWLHDCCAVGVYFCKECLEPTAISNQG